MEFGYDIMFVFIACLMPSGNTAHLTNDTTVSLHNQFLPIEWESMCILQDKAINDVYFKCNIDKKHSGKWRLDTLRDWISASNISYHFDVRCSGNSNITLSWPMKAKNLVGIKVTGCYIVDYFADSAFGKVLSDVEDQLISEQLIDCVIILDRLQLLYTLMNDQNQPKDVVCGHEDTIVNMVMRNVSYAYKDTEKSFEVSNSTNDTLTDRILDASENYLQDNMKIEYKCDFKKLQYIDYSIRSMRSKYDTDLLTSNSLYNELRVFNDSHSAQTSISSSFKEWWIYFPKLEVLDLSYNYISTFELDNATMEQDTSFLHMNLSYNNFTRITSAFIHHLVKIKNLKIDLEGNPFHCGCSPEMRKTIDLIQNPDIWKKSSYSRYKDFRFLKCASPKSARGKFFIYLTQNDMSCEMTSYAPIIILSFLVVFLLIIIIIIVRYRREIRILSYTRFHLILPCQPHERFQEKTFDAFVSYSSEDEVWVNKTFKALEKEEHKKGYLFRFCLHQRDFIAGKTIFDNVMDSVEASRHTVIILSKHFLESHWCLYEFHEAFQKSVMDRKQHLLLVLLDDIPEDDLPKELKRSLKTFTYIHKDDTIFHDRLVYALSFKGQKPLHGNDINKTKFVFPIKTESIT